MKKRGGRRMGVGGERERERLIIKAEYINIGSMVFSRQNVIFQFTLLWKIKEGSSVYFLS